MRYFLGILMRKVGTRKEIFAENQGKESECNECFIENLARSVEKDGRKRRRRNYVNFSLTFPLLQSISTA